MSLFKFHSLILEQDSEDFKARVPVQACDSQLLHSSDCDMTTA